LRLLFVAGGGAAEVGAVDVSFGADGEELAVPRDTKGVGVDREIGQPPGFAAIDVDGPCLRRAFGCRSVAIGEEGHGVLLPVAAGHPCRRSVVGGVGGELPEAAAVGPHDPEVGASLVGVEVGLAPGEDDEPPIGRGGGV